MSNQPNKHALAEWKQISQSIDRQLTQYLRAKRNPKCDPLLADQLLESAMACARMVPADWVSESASFTIANEKAGWQKRKAEYERIAEANAKRPDRGSPFQSFLNRGMRP